MSKNIILITGCARSGTSLTAGVINLCGAKGGETSQPTVNNKKGMFENFQIRDSLVKPLLKKVNADPMGQKPLPNISDFEDIDADDWRIKIENVFRSQGVTESDTWFYKGAKMCLMWNLWHKAFPDAKWIIVRRRSKEIVNSCLRTGFMRAYQTESGWQEWIIQHIKRFNEMLQADLNLREVWPQEMIDGQLDEIKSIIEWLDLEWDVDKVIEFISPKLWNCGKIVINDKEVR